MHRVSQESIEEKPLSPILDAEGSLVELGLSWLVDTGIMHQLGLCS